MNRNGIADDRSRIEIDELPTEIGVEPHHVMRVHMAVHYILTVQLTEHLQHLPNARERHFDYRNGGPHRMQDILLFGDRECFLFESSRQRKGPGLENEARREAVRIRQDFDESTQRRRFARHLSDEALLANGPALLQPSMQSCRMAVNRGESRIEFQENDLSSESIVCQTTHPSTADPLAL